MKLTEQFAEMMLNGMDKEEKMALIIRLSDHLVSSLSPEDRKDLTVRLVPAMMDKVFEGMGASEKRDLIGKLMPSMLGLLTEPTTR